MSRSLVAENLEWLLWALLLAVALIPLVRPGWFGRGAAGARGRGWAVALIGVLLVGALAAVGGWAWKRVVVRRVEARTAHLAKVPSEGRPGGYVSSDQCRSCHPREYDTWHTSFHRTMTQVSGPGSVLGDFGVGSLELEGESYRLERRGDEFWVELPDPDAVLAASARTVDGRARPAPVRVWRQVGLLTGSHHLQVYWVTSQFGNLQHVFPFCWLIPDQRWVPVRDTFLRDPHLAPYSQRWNNNCIRCHATGGQPRPPNPMGPPLSRAAELGIACEACHGPAETHVAQNRDPLLRYAHHLGLRQDSSIVNPARLSKKESAHACGQCHGIRWVPAAEKYDENGYSYRPGDDLDRSTPVVRPARLELQEFLREPLRRQPRFLDEHYWSDGEVRVSGREFNGLVESPCYERGSMTCLSCHSMHGYASNDDQRVPGRPVNGDCLQCHAGIGAKLAEHTHHPVGSAGSECYNCHMPHTTYGLMKAIRSHRVTTPDVRASLATGRPNACNLCHLDRSLAWTADHLARWYGKPAAPVPGEFRTVAAGVDGLLRGDAGQRALVAWHLGWAPAQAASGTAWIAPYLAQGLDDPYSTVRYISHRSLRTLPGFGRFEYDFVGPATNRTRASRRALEQWATAPGSTNGWTDPALRAALLLDARGGLNRVEYDRLLARRNLRSMDLQE